MKTNRVRGMMWAGVTALISGVAVFANSLVVQGMDPLVHTSVKNGMVGVMILIVLLVTGEGWKMKQLRGFDRVKLALIGVIGGSIPFVMFFTGLKAIGGVQGALIHKTLVFWVALLAVPFLGEKVSVKMIVGIVLLYLSNFALLLQGFGPLEVGHFLVLGATILWAIENVMAKVMLSKVPANVVVGSRMGLGSILLVGMLIVSGKAPLVAELTGREWLMLLGVAFLLFGYVMSWYRALAQASATVVASILVGATVVTTLLNGLFIDQSFGWNQLGQGVFIITGIWLVVMAVTDIWLASSKKKGQEQYAA